MELQRCRDMLHSWFAAHEGEMFALLEELVNMDTFTHDGEDVDKMGRVVRERMESFGFACEVLPHDPIPDDEPWRHDLGHMLVARSRPDAAEPGIGLLGHMDTVFPRGTAGARPFTLDRSADRATGPGVLDMKGGLVINMYAARALHELKLTDVPLTLTFSPDEELGSPNSGSQIVRVYNGACAAFCTEPGYLSGGVSVERKGSGHMRLDIRGVSAHAGRDYEKGASAILELAHKILAYQEHLDLEHEVTVNTGLVEGGTSANSVAPSASARIHLTFRTLEQGMKVVDAIRKDTAKTYIPNTSSHISGGLRLPPITMTPKVMALYALIERAAEAVGFPCRLERSKGAAESGICCSLLDLPVVCSMGPEGTGLHAPEEYLIPSTVLPRAEILALSALQAANTFAASPRVQIDQVLQKLS